MRLARVVGTVVSTIKNDTLSGKRLLILQHINSEECSLGQAFVATDTVGAGPGETVFYVRSKEAAFPFFPAETPTDATVVGIVDRINRTTDSR